MTADDLKKAAAAAAVELVRDGQKLGLGTGSTANHFIDLLAQRVKQGLKVEVVPTSKQSHERAKRAGIPLTTLEAHPYLDLTVDGTDEFDGGNAGRKLPGDGGPRADAPRRQTCCDLLDALPVATEAQRAPVFVDDEQGVGRPAGLALDE